MTPLRQRMIREMELRQFTPRTIESYVAAIVGLAKFHQRSPDQLQLDEQKLLAKLDVYSDLTAEGKIAFADDMAGNPYVLDAVTGKVHRLFRKPAGRNKGSRFVQ